MTTRTTRSTAPAAETGTPSIEAPDATPAEPTTPETPETPADETELVPPADTFEVEGTITLRGDGAPQGQFNLHILNKDAHALLLANMAFDTTAGQSVRVQNDQGEFWVSVKATAGARTKVRQARSSEVLLKGKLRLQKAVNGRYVGELFEVTSAQPVTLRNGGRHVERTRREDLEPVMESAARAGGQSGMRSLLGRLNGR